MSAAGQDGTSTEEASGFSTSRRRNALESMSENPFGVSGTDGGCSVLSSSNLLIS